MKTAIILSLSILMLGCGSLEKLKQTRENREFLMTVEIIDYDKINELCKNLGIPYPSNGCNKFNLDKKHCTIYIPPQRFAHDDRSLIIIGHETWHCIFGKWHSE